MTASADNSAKLWDAATGRELLTLKGHAKGLESAAFSPTGLSIVTASDDHTAMIWRAVSPEQVAAWLKEEATD